MAYVNDRVMPAHSPCDGLLFIERCTIFFSPLYYSQGSFGVFGVE